MLTDAADCTAELSRILSPHLVKLIPSKAAFVCHLYPRSLS